MELFLRAAALYFFIFIFMRASGHRQFSQMTAFDFVLLLIIAEVTGQAFVGEDYSVTGAIVVVAVLVVIDIALSLSKRYIKGMDKVMEGIPTLLINQGEILKENLKKERVDERDILGSAREMQGLESLDQVKYAVLEASGKISIVPWPDEGS